MGQYHVIYNVDKREYLSPHAFGHGAKLLEWGCSGPGINTGLALLLSNSNGRGGGDLYVSKELVKKRSGQYGYKPLTPAQKANQIVVQGDYAKDGDPGFISEDALKDYVNISTEVITALKVDEWLNKRLSSKYDFETERAEMIEELKQAGYKVTK